MSGVVDQRAYPWAVKRPAATHRELWNAQGGEDDRLPVLVAIDADHRYGEEAGDLSRNGCEQNVAGRTLGDQRGDPTQAGLLGCEPAKVFARLAAGDGSGD